MSLWQRQAQSNNNDVLNPALFRLKFYLDSENQGQSLVEIFVHAYVYMLLAKFAILTHVH